MSLLGLAAGVVFTVLLLWAALGDLRTRRIPNRLVLVIAILGIGYSAFGGRGVASGLGSSFGGIGIGLVCWLPFYVMGWLGAGDVKMFAASGAWLGPMRALEGSVVAALLGAVLALLWMLRVKGFRSSLETLTIATGSPGVLASGAKQGDVERGTIPYGIAMAAGAIWAAWLPIFSLL
ncbi:MAG TPA: prepilin peptidase [Gemmatimonadaceae bacterium]|nr:prepilin peptidase [Gemmatimonadaceae bacterium]